jgi:hypothetical protein
LGRLLRALEWAGVESGHGMPGEAGRRGIRHLAAQFAQVVPGDAAVQDALGIVHLTMTDEVDEGCGHPASLLSPLL